MTGKNRQKGGIMNNDDMITELVNWERKERIKKFYEELDKAIEEMG